MTGPFCVPVPEAGGSLLSGSLVGSISVNKPDGNRSWEILISLPRNHVYVSTPNLDWGLAFARDLIENTTPVDRNGAKTGGWLDETGRSRAGGFAFNGDK